MLPKLRGVTIRQAVHYFNTTEAAYSFGELMTENQFVVEYKNDGNCIAVITSTFEKEARNCATC